MHAFLLDQYPRRKLSGPSNVDVATERRKPPRAANVWPARVMLETIVSEPDYRLYGQVLGNLHKANINGAGELSQTEPSGSILQRLLLICSMAGLTQLLCEPSQVSSC